MPERIRDSRIVILGETHALVEPIETLRLLLSETNRPGWTHVAFECSRPHAWARADYGFKAAEALFRLPAALSRDRSEERSGSPGQQRRPFSARRSGADGAS